MFCKQKFKKQKMIRHNKKLDDFPGYAWGNDYSTVETGYNEPAYIKKPHILKQNQYPDSSLSLIHANVTFYIQNLLN